MGINSQKTIVLFCSSISRPEKNYTLAKESMKLIDNAELWELKGYSRKDVPILMNAVDVILMTSLHEGSPQVIKEALACNVPIVSTDVGDVKDLISNVKGCYLCEYEVNDVSDKIQLALSYNKKTNGRSNIIHLDETIVAQELAKIYKNCSDL